jgi:hypothetical protein
VKDLSSKTRTCFVIAPIGDENSEIRHRSDQIMRHIIEPAAQECGYRAIRADSISKPGIITSQVIQHLLDDDLVVADLTGHNPNVFYELAIRHAIRKPVVQLIQKGEAIPFDVSASRTIHVDHHDLDSVDTCLKELTQQIRAAEKNPSDVDTPISMAIDVQSLRRSANPQEKSTAQIISLLQDIRVRIDGLVKERSRLPDRRLRETLARELGENAEEREMLRSEYDRLERMLSKIDKTDPSFKELQERHRMIGESIKDIEFRLQILRRQMSGLDIDTLSST